MESVIRKNTLVALERARDAEGAGRVNGYARG